MECKHCLQIQNGWRKSWLRDLDKSLIFQNKWVLHLFLLAARGELPSLPQFMFISQPRCSWNKCIDRTMVQILKGNFFPQSQGQDREAFLLSPWVSGYVFPDSPFHCQYGPCFKFWSWCLSIALIFYSLKSFSYVNIFLDCHQSSVKYIEIIIPITICLRHR